MSVKDHEIGRDCIEWRFCGAFGFGGKLRYNPSHTGFMHMDYYWENQTPDLDAAQERVNGKLFFLCVDWDGEKPCPGWPERPTEVTINASTVFSNEGREADRYPDGDMHWRTESSLKPPQRKVVEGLCTAGETGVWHFYRGGRYRRKPAPPVDNT